MNLRYAAFALLIPFATIAGLEAGYQTEAHAEASEDSALVAVVKTADGDTHTFHEAAEVVVTRGEDSVTVTPILLAQADAGSAGLSAPALDAGPASAATPAPADPATGSAAPADKLHDPVASPQLALDDLKTAKKGGWGIFLFACLIMLCRVLGRLGGILKPLSQGRVAVVIAGINTLALTAFNALALGGTWFAVAAAAIVALAAFWDAQAKPREPTKA